MTNNLTTFVDNAQALRVMEHNARDGFDVGTAADVFGQRLALIQVGDAQGSDDQRGASEWYQLMINGETIGELRDDAAGMTIHIERRNHPNRSKKARFSNLDYRSSYDIIHPETGYWMTQGIQGADAMASDQAWPRGAEAWPAQTTEFDGQPVDVAK